MPGKRTSPVVKSAQRDLVITRTFNAPRSLVWEVWTEPRHIINWWGPRHHPAKQMTLDAQPGGSWRACLRSADTGEELWHRGTFREIIKPERIVFTFAWEEEGERGLETLVTLTFVEEGGKTRMTFHQTPFQSVGERDGHHEGWESCFDRLDEYAAFLQKKHE